MRGKFFRDITYGALGAGAAAGMGAALTLNTVSDQNGYDIVNLAALIGAVIGGCSGLLFSHFDVQEDQSNKSQQAQGNEPHQKFT